VAVQNPYRAAGIVLAASLACSLLLPSVPAASAGTVASARGAAAPTLEALAPQVLRASPAYAAGTFSSRLRPGNGPTDAAFRVKRPVGGQVLLGDWDGDGAVTPATFLDGHWVIYDSVVGWPKPTRSFDYGRASDVAVSGDWDGDGRDGIGVRRAGEWHLVLEARPGPTWRRFAFGAARGGRPVTGDWDGDGVTGIGVVSSGTWSLRPTPTGGWPTQRFSYGLAADVPVAGDWDGDGRDGIGVVRVDTWHLRQLAGPGRPNLWRTVARPHNSVPVPWPNRAGREARSCPTAAAVVGGRPATAADVRPSPLLDRPGPTGATQGALRQSLGTAERFLLGANYQAEYLALSRQPYLNLMQRNASLEAAVRGPAMEAQALAIGLRTDAFDAAAIGRSPDWATDHVAWLIRSIACQHVSVTPGGWGYGWQTAHWAMLTGLAAWLLWDHLTAEDRDDVTSMLGAEADRRTQLAAEYWQGVDGEILTPGDTKAEEDSWNSALLELAIAMMPEHPRVAAWRSRALELEIAAFSRLSDVTSSDVVNGRALSDWLQGANILPDGTLENHSRIHPDYMTTVQHLWWAADFAGLREGRTPRAALHNGSLVYAAFTRGLFSAPPYLAPGGTIYRIATGDVYYPQGWDWGPARAAPFLSLDAHAVALGQDGDAAWPAADALAARVAAQQALQARNADGRTYTDPAEDAYTKREEYAAFNLGMAWLALYVGAHAPLRVDDDPYDLPPEGSTSSRRAASGPGTPTTEPLHYQPLSP
jgi:hypothetical protein